MSETDPIPLLAMAQLYTRDVPDLEAPGDCDLLQVLWCPFDAHGEDRNPGVHLFWRTAADVAERLVDPPALEVVGRESYVPESCVLSPEQVVEHQWVELLPPSLQARIEEWDDWDEDEDEDENAGSAVHYPTDLSIPPGWKVGGFAPWPVTGPAALICDCGQQMKLLLTVASTEWNRGTRSWVPAEDQTLIGVRGANSPTQITVGRGGSLHTFVCPADLTHPHRLSLQ